MQHPVARNKIAFFFFMILLIASSPDSADADSTMKVKQGGIAHLSISPGPSVDSVSGEYRGQVIPFFETENGTYTALVGIDFAQKKGTQSFVVTWTQAEKKGRQDFKLEIDSAAFGVQKLTLPKGKVDLDPPTLARVNKEQALVKSAFAHSQNKKLWQGAFIVPVEGTKQGTFGRRRIINGQARNAHTGEDISAVEGTPIMATNHGRVALVGDFFFNGKSVIIDHGLGLFSMYFHLLDVAVAEGDSVKRADVIGRVGQTGRVTGPHLHWGMRLNEARIDPFALVAKKLD